MDLTPHIKSAEKRFKQILEGYFASVYNEKILPSHGLSHHRRVWLYARDLISEKNINQNISDPQFPFNLIIACYLHDLGMSVEHGPDHGKHSSLFCRKFLQQYNLRIEDYPGLPEAIENHDKKDYTNAVNDSYLNLILSVADDLDAFGITGIYRYAEIYSDRGTGNESFGTKIRENAMKRFNHFRQEFECTGSLFQKHKERYLLLDQFFGEYEKELQFRKNSYPTGRTGVVEIIRLSLEQQNDLDDLISTGIKARDEFIKDFFTRLQKENITC